jgi:DNA-binding transcriptional LysR family regulator
MDIRVLKYFITVANEGNITKAAEILHITQPTLSRQLMDLEEELGVRLFVRGKRQITLTDSGIIFQQRVKEIVSLLEKTQRDLEEHKSLVGGVISIGCVESVASEFLSNVIRAFSKEYPLVKYEIYSADSDDIKEKLDRGNIDIAILIEPVEKAKYDFFSLPCEEIWGILVKKDDEIASKKCVSVSDISNFPLIFPRRTIVMDEIEKWFGVERNTLNIVATQNLLSNSVLLVKNGVGYAVCVEGAYSIRKNDETVFIPFEPKRKSGHVLAWKKNVIFNSATRYFIEMIKDFI